LIFNDNLNALRTDYNVVLPFCLILIPPKNKAVDKAGFICRVIKFSINSGCVVIRRLFGCWKLGQAIKGLEVNPTFFIVIHLEVNSIIGKTAPA